MNEQKTGLSGNELEQVSGGKLIPDTDENRRVWTNLIRDIQTELNRIMVADMEHMPRCGQQRLRACYDLARDCYTAAGYRGDPFRVAQDLFYSLSEFRIYPEIDRLAAQLQTLAF